MSLDLLPSRSCLSRSWEGRRSRGKVLGTSSSLAGTAAQAAAGLQLKHKEKREADVKARFIGGIRKEVARLQVAGGCQEAGRHAGPGAVVMGLGGQGQPGALHGACLMGPADRERAGGGLQPTAGKPSTQQSRSLHFEICCYFF